MCVYTLSFKDSAVILASRSHAPFWPLFTHFLHILCWHKQPKTFFTPQLSDRKIHLFYGFVLSALCNHVEHKLIANRMWKWQEEIRWFYGAQECSSCIGSAWILRDIRTSQSLQMSLISAPYAVSNYSLIKNQDFFSLLPSSLTSPYWSRPVKGAGLFLRQIHQELLT